MDLCEGIEEIGCRVFYQCESLECIKVPSSVKAIGAQAFQGCQQLVELELCEGVEDIQARAFCGCKSLKHFKVPSTVNKIGNSAFRDCMRLAEVELNEGLARIGYNAFHSCRSLESIKIPSSVEDISGVDGGAFYACSQLVEVIFLGKNVVQLGRYTFGRCESLKSIKVPSSTDDRWGCPPILYAIWGDAPDDVIQFLISSQKSAFPDRVLDWDKMVETLCRAGVESHAVLLLLDTHQMSFPEQSINWQKVGRELVIRSLIERIDCGYFVDDDDEEDKYYSRESFFLELGAVIESCSASRPQELSQYLAQMQQRFAADRNDANFLQLMCEEFIQPLKGWWRPGDEITDSMKAFQFLIKHRVAERSSTILVQKWRMDIKHSVQRISLTACWKLAALFDTIQSKLETYEREYPQLIEGAFLLELALWKSKIDQLEDGTAGNARGECRINCGADIIIPNVLPYLIAIHQEEGNGSDGDESSGEEDSDEGEDSEEGDGMDED